MDNLNLPPNLEKEKEAGVEREDFFIEKNRFEQPEKSAEKKSEINAERKKELSEIPAEIWQAHEEPSVGAPGIDTHDSPLHQSIEAILEDDLEEIYFSMSPKDQEKFKKKGEQTTSQIIRLVETGKVTFQKVFKLILRWLKIIPGVNKYYLEQEAKIKADRIQNLSRAK